MTSDEDFLEFRRLPSENLAMEMMEALDKEGIPTKMSNTLSPISDIFSQANSPQFIVNLKERDFEKAEDVLKTQFGISLADVAPDYYLLHFSKAELYAILYHYDQWASHDFDMAAALLRQRGESLSDQVLADFKANRYAHLAKPHVESKELVHYALAAVLTGGILGAIYAWDLWQGNKVLPDGKRVYQYSKKDRSLGKRLFIASMILLPVSIFLFFLQVFT